MIKFRTINFVLVAAILIGLSSSCGKRKETLYPIEMEYGKNILAEGVSVQSGSRFSAGAKLGKKATLKIVFTNLMPVQSNGQDFPNWGDARAQGWIISDYKNRQQTYTANKDGTVISMFVVSANTGSIQVDYFENSSSVTKSKILTW